MDGAATFGLWLRQRRKVRDLTQEQLAALVGCAAATIRKIEADARRPSREMADRLAQMLDVPSADRANLIRWARERPTGASDETSREQAVAVAAMSAPTDGIPVEPAPLRVPIPLLHTKLYIPKARSALVPRARLLARLGAGAAGRLTVVVAPPGFGKTTLLAEWLREARRAVGDAQEAVCVGWLSLDAGDNDLALFLRYLIAVLQTIAPEVGLPALQLLEAGRTPHVPAILSLLVAELARLPQRSILVLDDYHTIDASPVHEVVGFLLDHLPPQLHLAIGSRADPPLALARLRVRHEVTELRAADLRFTPVETAMFLRGVMQLPLSLQDAAVLEARTEGWAAGLQLAALSLQERPSEQITTFVRTFAGSHHFVVDYLVDEVLARQPAHLQTFLLQTSILGRMCGSLCDAVLGVTLDQRPTADDRREAVALPAARRSPFTDSYSQLLLAELERMNLFLVSLDDERRWYRYHHLFADVLRERLLRGAAPAEIETLHRRASAWFEQRDLIAEAVRHALAARAWDQAARLVERAGGAVVLGNMQQHQTLRAWMEALPEHVVRARTNLCLLRARLAMLTDLEQAETWVRHAEQPIEAVAPAEDRSNTRGAIAALRAGLAASRGAPDDAIGQVRQALADLDPTNLGVRGEVMGYLARAYLFQHDAARAADAFAQMARLTRAASDHVATFVPEANLAYLQRLQGKLSLAVLTCRATLASAAEHGVDTAPDASWVLAGLADLLRERNDLDAALVFANDASVRSKQLAIPNLTLLCSLVLARVHQARGEVAQALTIVGQMRDAAEQFRVVPVQALSRAFEAQLHLQQGELAAAMALVGEQELQETDAYWISPILVIYNYEHLAIARAQILLAHGRATGDQQQLRAAMSLLGRQQQHAEREGLPWLRVKVLALQALVEQALGNRSQALTSLGHAIALAAPEGLTRVLLDEGPPLATLLAQSALRSAQNNPVPINGERLLSASPQPGHEAEAVLRSRLTGAHTSLEPLTPREAEILRLLAAGRSTQAIAQELLVAVGTVKRHVANILSKLQVDSRLSAVARARELGLL